MCRLDACYSSHLLVVRDWRHTQFFCVACVPESQDIHAVWVSTEHDFDLFCLSNPTQVAAEAANADTPPPQQSRNQPPTKHEGLRHLRARPRGWRLRQCLHGALCCPGCSSRSRSACEFDVRVHVRKRRGGSKGDCLSSPAAPPAVFSVRSTALQWW